MQQGYGKSFAQVYNKKWIGFATSVSPKIEALLQSRPAFGHLPKTILDICCGTGQFAAHFLNKGYSVHGLDLSPYMIEIARENNKANEAAGTASFSVQDASQFHLDAPFSYAVCLFDAMNHLESMQSVVSCFQRTYDVLAPQGLFVFDINTRKGLHRWNSLSVQEDDEVFILNRGIFEDGMDRAYTQITGFLRGKDGNYQRFNETAHNLVLSVQQLVDSLKSQGFSNTYSATLADLSTPAPNPEELDRAFIISQKG